VGGNNHTASNGNRTSSHGNQTINDGNCTTSNGHHTTHNGLDVQDSDGQTALHIAVRTGQAPMMKALLRAGADLEVKERAGRTALHLAVVMGEEGLVRLLLLDGKADAGAKVGYTGLGISGGERGKREGERG